MENNLVWQLTSPNHVVSYMFGTMHIRDPQVVPLLDRVKGYIVTADRYYSEIEIETGIGDLKSFQQLPPGRTIADYMSGNHYQRLRRSIRRAYGLDIHHFGTLYPLILSNMIQTSILGQDLDTIMDYHLFQYARDQGKEMHFLESQAEQIALFHQIPMEYQINSLKLLGRQPAKAKRQLRSLLHDYAQGQTRQLYQKSKKQLGKIRHLLLYQRNENMSQTIVRELDNASGFVAVGAAHLFGYHGILRKLKNSGFIIQPL